MRTFKVPARRIAPSLVFIAMSFLMNLNAFAKTDPLSARDRFYTESADNAAELARLRKLVQTQQELIRASKEMTKEQKKAIKTKKYRTFQELLRITAKIALAWYGPAFVYEAVYALCPYFYKYVYGEIPSWLNSVSSEFIGEPTRDETAKWAATYHSEILNAIYGAIVMTYQSTLRN